MAFEYRRITGLFTARIPDGSDADEYPDTVPLSGRVTFYPEYRKPLVFPGEHIVLEPIPALLVDGQLMVEVLQGDDVVLQDLWLPVTMDERANQSWAWRMVFDHVTLGQYGDEVSLPDRRFPVEEGEGPLDLSDVAGTWSGGTLITRGAPGPGLQEIVAENGEITFLWDNSRTTTIEVPDAVEGPEGPRGERGPQGPAGTVELVGGAATITVDTSVGTRVLVGGVMIYGDTGWRNISSLLTFRDDYINMSGSPTPTLIVRRTLNEVEFRLEFRARAAPLPSTVPTIASGIPAGFRAQFMREILLDGSNFSGAVGMINGSGGSIVGRVITDGAGRLVWGSGRYRTSDAWPTVLPGTAA